MLIIKSFEFSLAIYAQKMLKRYDFLLWSMIFTPLYLWFISIVHWFLQIKLEFSCDFYNRNLWVFKINNVWLDMMWMDSELELNDIWINSNLMDLSQSLAHSKQDWPIWLYSTLHNSDFRWKRVNFMKAIKNKVKFCVPNKWFNLCPIIIYILGHLDWSHNSQILCLARTQNTKCNILTILIILACEQNVRNHLWPVRRAETCWLELEFVCASIMVLGFSLSETTEIVNDFIFHQSWRQWGDCLIQS